MRRQFLLCLLHLCASTAWSADALVAGQVAVLFPDIREPYRGIFTKIIEGIEDKLQGKVVAIAVPSSPNMAELQENLKRLKIRVVIGLGRQGVNLAYQLDRDFAVMGGAVLSASEDESKAMRLYSLMPEPALLFARAKFFNPNIKRVTVVYDPRQNAWLIKQAREAAKNIHLELHAHEAQELKAAMAIYQQFLASAEAGKDALWLPQDSSTVQESAVLPTVLRGAWDRNLMVFSSNLQHVEKGVLFALYPNNLELGREIGIAARTLSVAQSGRGMQSLRAVQAAINTSTASHLGINLSKLSTQFDVIFPER